MGRGRKETENRGNDKVRERGEEINYLLVDESTRAGSRAGSSDPTFPFHVLRFYFPNE